MIPSPQSRAPFAEHEIMVLLVDDQAMIGEAVRRMLAPETDIRFRYCSDPAAAVQ
ncbi:MAG: diguanylate cyclase response regulator, partial [candidate division NC10 bacterium]